MTTFIVPYHPRQFPGERLRIEQTGTIPFLGGPFDESLKSHEEAIGRRIGPLPTSKQGLQRSGCLLVFFKQKNEYTVPEIAL
jgi:hypothetical protein